MACVHLALPTHKLFDPSQHAYRADVLGGLPGLQLVVQWTKTLQGVGATPVIPIPQVQGHPANPVHAYKDLSVSPTTHSNHPLLTIISGGTWITVIISMLVAGIKGSIASSRLGS